MNVIAKASAIVVIVFGASVAADVGCVNTLTIDLETVQTESLAGFHFPATCKIAKLYLIDKRPAQSSLENKDPEEGLVAVKESFASLRALQGKMAFAPRIFLEIPFIMTSDYNKNMNRINALLAVLGIQVAEVSGLATEKIENPKEEPSRLMFYMGALTCAPLAASHISHMRAGGGPAPFGYAFAACTSVHAGAHYLLPRIAAVAVAAVAAQTLMRLGTPLLRTYLAIEGAVLAAGQAASLYFAPPPPPMGYVYCIGPKPFQITQFYNEDFPKTSFHRERLEKFCEQAFEEVREAKRD